VTVVAEARIHVAAPPERVYALVSDVTRMGDWSPETTACEWVDGATGPAVGAWFEGTNKAGRSTWKTRRQIDVAELGRELTFTVHAGGSPSSRWTYRFEPAGDGTDVIESMEGFRSYPLPVRLLQRLFTGVKDRASHNAAGMQRTLERIKAAAER
jgi:uncharacterized protein YndB with AHSA1/START domain